MSSAGIILAVEVSIYIFDQWGWFMPFYSDDFPGQYKRLHKHSLTLFLIHLAAEQTNVNMRRVHPICGPLFSLKDHSFIIYSFLLDQQVLDTSSWMLNSCSNIRNCSLPPVRLTVQGFLSSWHQSFWNSLIFSSTDLIYPFLNVTGQDNQFALLLKRVGFLTLKYLKYTNK